MSLDNPVARDGNIVRPFGSMKAWLFAETPTSRHQALLGRLYVNWLHLRGSVAAITGLLIIVALILTAIFAPLLATDSPTAQDLMMRLQPPSAEHWFGTDEFGRDIYSRVIHGTRVTLYIVLLVGLTAGPVGLVIGCTAGALGGWVDVVLMRITDIVLAFPRLILALAFVAALGPSLEHAVLAITLTAWPAYTRIARAETLTIRNSDFIAAVRLAGASRTRIILKHIIPLCMPSLVVRATLDMAGVILIAAGLGFLGLGAQPPTPEWGAMLATGRQFLLGYWWVATMPGLAIFIVSMGFNLFGDGIRDVLDPRQRS